MSPSKIGAALDIIMDLMWSLRKFRRSFHTSGGRIDFNAKPVSYRQIACLQGDVVDALASFRGDIQRKHSQSYAQASRVG